jgi:hypothetical protein
MADAKYFWQYAFKNKLIYNNDFIKKSIVKGSDAPLSFPERFNPAYKYTSRF